MTVGRAWDVAGACHKWAYITRGDNGSEGKASVNPFMLSQNKCLLTQAVQHTVLNVPVSGTAELGDLQRFFSS